MPKDESSMSKSAPKEAFFIRYHADMSCMPESVVPYCDFESALESVKDEFEQQDPDFPFYEAEVKLDDITEDELKRWGSYILLSCIGEHALGGVLIAYINDADILDEWWDEEMGDWADC